MTKRLYILVLILAPLAGVLANYAPRNHVGMGLFDQRLPRQLVFVGDEKKIVFYNQAEDGEWYYWSMRADANMVTDVNYVWPYHREDPNAVLFIRQVEDGNEVYLDWGPFDANWVRVDGNDFTFPLKTPWNVMFVDANGYPLSEDPNYFTYYQPEGAFGVGIENIAEGLYANNYIQVYTLLDFEPNLLNVTIGRGTDDTVTGSNDVTVGYGAGESMSTASRNTLMGSDSGYLIQLRSDDALYGFESGKNIGGGAISGSTDTYKYTYISENGSVWGVPIGDKTVVYVTAGPAVNIGGGVVGIPYNNAAEDGEQRFLDGQVVWINGTTNYNGSYTLLAGTTTTQLQITETYNAETFDGTETVVRWIGSLPSGGGHSAVDSDGNIYYGHDYNATWGYVTKIAPDGTKTSSLSFLTPSGWPLEANPSTSLFGMAISPDDYLYVWIQTTGPTTHGYMQKYDLSTGANIWAATSINNPQYAIALDSDGNAYASIGAAANVRKYAAADGSQSDVAESRCNYDIVINEDLGIFVTAMYEPSYGYSLSITPLAGGSRDVLDLGTSVGRGCMAFLGDYLYVLYYTTKWNISKISFSGVHPSVETTVDGPTQGAGLFVDIWGNIVVVNQDWTVGVSDVFYYYDADLTYITDLSGFYTSMFRTWDAAAGGLWIQGNVQTHPTLIALTDSGSQNTAVGSGALRGINGGAEPNDAAVVGYQAGYNVSTANKPTSIGVYSLGQLSSGDNDIAVGPYSGWPITTEDDYIVFESRQRSSIDEMETHSIIVGQTADDPNDQWLSINVGELNLDFGRFDVNDVNVSNDLVVAGQADFNDVTITGSFSAVDGEFTGTLDVNDVNSTGDVILQGATATRLLATDASKYIVSTDADDWIDGTTNQITVTDDSDGTVTLSTPQDIDTEADVQFGSVELTKGTGFLVLVSGDYLLLTDASSKLLFSGTSPIEDAVVFITASNKLGMDENFLWDSPTSTLSLNGTSKFGDGGTTDYLNIDSDGDTRWVGGGGIPFGCLYGNEIGWNNGGAAQNVWTTVSDADITAGPVHDIVYENNQELTVTYAGHYLAAWTLAVESSVANKHVTAGPEVNGTETAAGRTHFEITSANNQVSISGMAILDLAADDSVSLGVMCDDVVTPTIAVDHYNLTLTMLGGT